MTPSLDPLAGVESVADLLERLGGIPAERVRFHPMPGTATESDVLSCLQAPRKRICELVDGILVEKPMGYRESLLAGYLLSLLNAFTLPRNLGLVTGSDGSVRLMAGLVRFPDVAFASWDRIPGRVVPAAPIPDLVPDLAIEILSLSNTAGEMARKRQEYFAAGVRAVWEIDPDLRTAEVFTAVGTSTILTRNDTLTGDPVLPGFTLSLADLFAVLDRQG